MLFFAICFLLHLELFHAILKCNDYIETKEVNTTNRYLDIGLVDIILFILQDWGSESPEKHATEDTLEILMSNIQNIFHILR